MQQFPYHEIAKCLLDLNFAGFGRSLSRNEAPVHLQPKMGGICGQLKNVAQLTPENTA